MSRSSTSSSVPVSPENPAYVFLLLLVNRTTDPKYLTVQIMQFLVTQCDLHLSFPPPTFKYDLSVDLKHRQTLLRLVLLFSIHHTARYYGIVSCINTYIMLLNCTLYSNVHFSFP